VDIRGRGWQGSLQGILKRAAGDLKASRNFPLGDALRVKVMDGFAMSADLLYGFGLDFGQSSC
jgi:hypothetical protein